MVYVSGSDNDESLTHSQIKKKKKNCDHWSAHIITQCVKLTLAYKFYNFENNTEDVVLTPVKCFSYKLLRFKLELHFEDA